MPKKKLSAVLTFIKLFIKALFAIFLVIAAISVGIAIFDAEASWGRRAFFGNILIIIGLIFYKLGGKSIFRG